MPGFLCALSSDGRISGGLNGVRRVTPRCRIEPIVGLKRILVMNKPITQGIDHLGLSVSDLNASLAFFQNALGWTQVGGNPGYPAAFITDGVSRLTLWQCKGDVINGFNRHANVGLHHVALKVPTAEALREVFAAVRDWPGVKVEFAPELAGKGPREHFMFYEPGGARIEVSFNPQ